MIRAVEVDAIPAAEALSVFLSETNQGTHVGYKMLDRIPPGQGVVGKPSVSSFASAHGAALSPPKFAAL
jgi:hypothetical protein